MRFTTARRSSLLLAAGLGAIALASPASADPFAPCNDGLAPNSTECGTNSAALICSAEALGSTLGGGGAVPVGLDAADPPDDDEQDVTAPVPTTAAPAKAPVSSVRRVSGIRRR